MKVNDITQLKVNAGRGKIFSDLHFLQIFA
jgi:hypothetical protein